jgi:hypothetical protein
MRDLLKVFASGVEDKKTIAIEKTANKAHVKNFLKWPKEP